MPQGNDILALHGVKGLNAVTGQATGLIECEVVTLHTNGTLDARGISRRTVNVSARYPLWYEPALGDRVLVAEVQGDQRLRVVLQVICTKTGGVPAVNGSNLEFS